MIKCKIFRHGQTDWNKLKKVQGHSDIPLNEQGIKDAFNLSINLEKERFDRIYSSDLIRAYKTACIATKREDIIKTSLLREIDFGDFDGFDCQDLRVKHKNFIDIVCSKKHYLRWFLRFPNGETKSEAFLRLIKLLCEVDLNYKNQKIAFFSHSDLMLMIFEVNNIDVDYIPNCGGISFCFDERTMSFSDIFLI